MKNQIKINTIQKCTHYKKINYKKNINSWFTIIKEKYRKEIEFNLYMFPFNS